MGFTVTPNQPAVLRLYLYNKKVIKRNPKKVGHQGGLFGVALSPKPQTLNAYPVKGLRGGRGALCSTKASRHVLLLLSAKGPST